MLLHVICICRYRAQSSNSTEERSLAPSSSFVSDKHVLHCSMCALFIGLHFLLHRSFCCLDFHLLPPPMPAQEQLKSACHQHISGPGTCAGLQHLFNCFNPCRGCAPWQIGPFPSPQRHAPQVLEESNSEILSSFCHHAIGPRPQNLTPAPRGHTAFWT